MYSRNFKHVLVFIIVLLSNVAANLPEGAPCSVDGYPGQCLLWKKCFNLALDASKNNFPPLCSYDGPDPIICCTSCDLTDDVSKVVLSHQGGVLKKTDQTSWTKCIEYSKDLPYKKKDSVYYYFSKFWNDTRECFKLTVGIVQPEWAAGGRYANRAEFPHMALLGYGETESSAQWLCGGSLLNERFILTAGHCISSVSLGPIRFAALGILKRSDPRDMWQIYSISRIIPHPQYRPPAKYHDIALLQTTRRISFNVNVLPTCLPNLEEPIKDERALATGWGRTGRNTALANNLQAVKVTKFKHLKCSTLFKKHRLLKNGYSKHTQMCYGDDNKVRDTCEGDSGGPLQVWGQAYVYQGTVIGVTSYGPECRGAGQAGMYTRVAPYVPWIDSIIWE